MSHLATEEGSDQSDAFRSAVESGGGGGGRKAGEYAPTFDIKRPTEKWIL